MRQRLAFPVYALVVFGTLLSGCGKTKGGGEDIAFLADDPRPVAIPAPSRPLMPSGPGARWRVRVEGADGKGWDEDLVVVGNKALPGGVNRVRYESRRDGKAYRSEVYDIGPSGIAQVTAGGDDTLEMVPPMTIVPLPLLTERVVSWQGSLKFRGKSSIGEASTRLRGTETVRVPAGEFRDAYRVETILKANLGGQQVDFPTTRWFAPGVGIVQTRFAVNGLVYSRVLVRYQPPN